MIIPYLIDTLLADTIKALPFVERYGGVVQTLTSKQIGQGNKTKIKKYPVSCSVTEKDCNDTTLYSELVPDQSKKSIVYWELTSPMQSVGETPNLSQFTKKRFRGTARLVIWLNLQELGHKEIDTTVPVCQGASYTVPSVFKALSKNGNLLGGQYAGNRVQIEPNRVITDLNTIFGKYDYPDDLNYYLYPFSFYAVDVNFTMDMCLDNDFVFPVYDPIKCIDYSGGSITPVLPSDLFIHINPAIGINSGNPVNGESIFLAADQSGNNNDFIQLLGGLQPSWNLSGINGMPTINFNTASYLYKDDVLLSTENLSFFIVLKRNGDQLSGGYNSFAMIGASSYLAAGMEYIHLRDGLGEFLFRTINGALNENLVNITSDTILISFIKSSTGVEYFINGVSLGINLGVQIIGGQFYSFGGWSGNLSNMELGEYLFWDRALNAIETQTVHDILINKFAI